MTGFMFTDVGDGAESLHVKVMEVKMNSKARKVGVHTQMYLKSLALSSGTGESFGPPIFIGGDACRKRSEPTDNAESTPQERRPVDLGKLIALVDGVLTSAYLNRQTVKVDLVYYKT